MDDRTAQLLRALASVPADGPLEPIWNAASRTGVTYRGTASALDDDRLGEDLEYLADRDYVDRVFAERLSLCASCQSHAVNVHEACVSCGSSDLAQFKALLHFRCGYVGPVTAFREEPSGLRCPKCSRILADLGTDHDSPGDYFRCRACTAMFQVPDVGARCLSCGARFTGQTMVQIGHRDVFAYRLTSLGKAALAEQRLAAEPADAQALAGRNVLLGELEAARRARIESGKRFGLLVVLCGLNGTASAQQDVAGTVLREAGRDARVGRLDDRHIVVLLPGASDSATNSMRGRVAQLSSAGVVRAETLDLADGESISDALDVAARRMDANE